MHLLPILLSLVKVVVVVVVLGPTIVDACGPVTSGTWGEWEQWSACNKLCDGTRSKERFCTGDKYCKTADGQNEKNETVVQRCNVNTCDGRWGSWSTWNECYQCRQWRSRICFEAGKLCRVDDPAIEAQDAQVDRRSCESPTCAEVEAARVLSSQNNTTDGNVIARHVNPP